MPAHVLLAPDGDPTLDLLPNELRQQLTWRTMPPDWEWPYPALPSGGEG